MPFLFSSPLDVQTGPKSLAQNDFGRAFLALSAFLLAATTVAAQSSEKSGTAQTTPRADALQDLATLQLTLPSAQNVTFERRSLVALPSLSENGPSEVIRWLGTSADGTEVDLVSVDGEVRGHVLSSDGHFAVQGSASNLRTKLTSGHSSDVETFCPGGLAVPRDLANFDRSASTRTQPSSKAATLDVLVAYTPAALSDLGGPAAIESELLSAVSFLERGFSNTGINARARLVGITETPQLANAGTLNAVLDRARKDSALTKRRNDLGADVVVTLVGRNEVERKYCGLGYVMDRGSTSSSMAPFAFSVANTLCDLGSVLAHEVGHNLGLNHDPENSNTAKSNAYRTYAYGHRVAGKFKTIMSYGSEVRDRLLLEPRDRLRRPSNRCARRARQRRHADRVRSRR